MGGGTRRVQHTSLASSAPRAGAAARSGRGRDGRACERVACVRGLRSHPLARSQRTRVRARARWAARTEFSCAEEETEPTIDGAAAVLTSITVSESDSNEAT